MNDTIDTYILVTCVVIDDLLKAWQFEDDCRATGQAIMFQPAVQPA